MSDVDELVASYSKLSTEDKKRFREGALDIQQETKGFSPKFKKDDKVMYNSMPAKVLSQNFKYKITTLERVNKITESGGEACMVKDAMPVGTVLHISSESEHKVGDQILYDLTHLSTLRGLGAYQYDKRCTHWHWDKKAIKVLVTEVCIVYRIDMLLEDRGHTVGEILSGVTEDKLSLMSS